MTFWRQAGYGFTPGDTVQVSTGPAAAMEAIKQIGTNGEVSLVPTQLIHLKIQIISPIWSRPFLFLIPMALLFALGHMIRRKNFRGWFSASWGIGFISLCIPSCINEMNRNKAFVKMRLEQSTGSMEGKEIRFGAAASAYWAINTTCTSNGSVEFHAR